MSDDTEGSGAGEDTSNKVAVMLEEYDLPGLGDELEATWTATGDEHRSLRSLAKYFNKELLRKQLAEAGIQTVDGEVENMYRHLTDEEAETDRIRLERRLEREGIDTESLRDQFVSYQTIRRYLQEVREATYDRPDVNRLEKEGQNLRRLRGQTESVTRNKLEQLRDSELTLGEFRATVDVRVFCEDCQTQYDLDTLLERGGCGCSR